MASDLERGLFKIVCTPIGNLGDFSERAKEALFTADLILAEDTRETAKLLGLVGEGRQYSKIISCNQHNELSRLSLVLESLSQNKNICLVSDAGAPGLSDPGGRLIAEVIKAGFSEQIEILPGPTALTAALMGSGLDMTRFVFLGFLPKKNKERESLVTNNFANQNSLIIYEAANRVLKTLDDLFEILGEQKVVVARELTKKFETFHRTKLGSKLSPEFNPKGECVILVEANKSFETHNKSSSLDLELINLLLDKNLTQKDLAKKLQTQYDLKRKEAYNLSLDCHSVLRKNRAERD